MSRPTNISVSICLLLMVMAMAVATNAAAKGPRGREHRGPPPLDRVLERHADRLNIAPETRDQIRRIASTSRDASDPIRERLRALHDEMRELLGAETPDEARVMEQAERIGEAEVSLQKHRLRATLRIRALLTPEQRSELVKIHAERKGRGKPRRGPNDRRGPPPLDEPPPRVR